MRRLTVGDEATAEVACHTFAGEGDVDVARFLGREDVHLVVAEDDDGIAGWVYGQELLHPDGETTMLLYGLDVAERAQRRGHGAALVAAFVDVARRRACTEVWVLTEADNDAGLATYAAAGGDRDPGQPVMFTWKLRDGRHS